MRSDVTDQEDPISRRQRDVLDALRRIHERDGVAPSLRELATEVGLTSASSVLHHVRELIDRGLVVHRPGYPRTLRPSDDRDQAGATA